MKKVITVNRNDVCEAVLEDLLTAPLKYKLLLSGLLLITGFFPITLKWMNEAAEREEKKKAPSH